MLDDEENTFTRFFLSKRTYRTTRRRFWSNKKRAVGQGRGTVFQDMRRAAESWSRNRRFRQRKAGGARFRRATLPRRMISKEFARTILPSFYCLGNKKNFINDLTGSSSRLTWAQTEKKVQPVPRDESMISACPSGCCC